MRLEIDHIESDLQRISGGGAEQIEHAQELIRAKKQERLDALN